MRQQKGKTILLWLIVLCAWTGLALQFDAGVIRWINEGIPVGEALIRFFSYFTILTNLLIAVTSTLVLLSPRSKPGLLCARPGTITAIAVYIIVVSLVYNLALRGLYHLEGWARMGDELVHVVVPVLYVLYCLLFATKGSAHWVSAFGWLLYPLLYLVYTFLHGWFTGYYPYPFIDVKVIGYGGFWLNSFYLLLLFVAMNLIMIAIDKGIAKRSQTNLI